MFFYPAIDLKDGQCVRLLQGDMSASTVVGSDPNIFVKQFLLDGCERIHVIDLNGAIEGKSVNADSVKRIIDTSNVPVQLGGGIRTYDDIVYWLSAGVSRVIIGTSVLKDPELVEIACRDFPDKIVIGIDARNGNVAVEGWVEESTTNFLDLAKLFEDRGAAALIYTDINRDGTLKGPNIQSIAELVNHVSLPIIAAGGVSSIDDIINLKTKVPELEGIISGRAIYNNCVDVGEAIRILRE